MLALADGHGGLYAHHAEGSFAVVLGELDASELAAIAAWVEHGTSSYTAADAAGRGFEGHEVLREAGANSLIVLPLASAGERLGAAACSPTARRHRSAPRRPSCSSCSPPRRPAGCGWPPPCSSCASAPRATR